MSLEANKPLTWEELAACFEALAQAFKTADPTTPTPAIDHYLARIAATRNATAEVANV